MNYLSREEINAVLLGIVALLWCCGLVLYAISSSRSIKRHRLDKVSESFAVFAERLAERLKERGPSK
jgi:hypothetical protein